jgi:hypothetical protein
MMTPYRVCYDSPEAVSVCPAVQRTPSVCLPWRVHSEAAWMGRIGCIWAGLSKLESGQCICVC